jgi:diguanylate cyclase (GGDEF)-like protein
VAAIGILGAHWSAGLGKDIAGNELATSTETGELARTMDSADVTGEEAFLSASPALRAHFLGELYASLLPTADVQLSALERIHAGDPPAEHADIERFVRQWMVVRDLLSPTNVAAHPDTVLATELATAYLPVGQHLDRLFIKEQMDGHADQLRASASAARTIWVVVGVAAAGLLAGGFLLYRGLRRVREAVQPGEDQEEFADTMQIANDEEEAHLLLQRYLERILAPKTTAVVLNSNNSADRLEAVVPLPAGSPLAQTLRGAAPRSCLAVRSGRMHREGSSRLALLSCPVCAPCAGASSCVPLVVGGKVIGSVLLNRPTAFDEADEHRIRESVSQSAPVLANLRNLAIAEIRAATDGLTGLPNKRAVTDTLKRMFAQAATERSPLSLLMLDLDHFKQVNDQRGHAVGDQVLANVGAVMKGAMRSRDFAGRNGGEEFAILLPNTEIPVALRIAERVRAAIAEMSLPGIDVGVTVSVGVAGYPEHASTPDRLARLADAALYLAKRQGRNRVELAEPSVVGTFDPARPAGPPDRSGPPASTAPSPDLGPVAPRVPGPRSGDDGQGAGGNGNGQTTPRERARNRGDS